MKAHGNIQLQGGGYIGVRLYVVSCIYQYRIVPVEVPFLKGGTLTSRKL